MERIAAQHHFEMPQSSQEGLYLPWGQAQEGPRRPLPELLMGQDCSRREAPSTAHVLLGPLGQTHWCPYGQMGGAVHRESPHITYPCGPWEL